MSKDFMMKGSDFLGVKYPIIAGGMTRVSDYELVKAVSEAGGFPVFAAGNMPAVQFEEQIDRLVADLNKPFGVNLLTVAPNYRSHYEVLLKKDVEFVVFADTIPSKKDIEGMKSSGARTMSFAANNSVAKKLIKSGIDALILEGSEAGGHIGPVALSILLQDVLLEHRGFPIFVAGGIVKGEMMAQMLIMGAFGVQLGTAFMLSEECTIDDNFKLALKKAHARQAVALQPFDDSHPRIGIRAIKNSGMNKIKDFRENLVSACKQGDSPIEEVYGRLEMKLDEMLCEATEKGNVDHSALMAGQSVGLTNEIKPVQLIIDEMVDSCKKELERIRAEFL